EKSDYGCGPCPPVEKTLCAFARLRSVPGSCNGEEECRRRNPAERHRSPRKVFPDFSAIFFCSLSSNCDDRTSHLGSLKIEKERRSWWIHPDHQEPQSQHGWNTSREAGQDCRDGQQTIRFSGTSDLQHRDETLSYDHRGYECSWNQLIDAGQQPSPEGQ